MKDNIRKIILKYISVPSKIKFATDEILKEINKINWIENDFGKTVLVGFIGKVEVFSIDKNGDKFKLWENSKKHFYDGTVEELKKEAEYLISNCT